MVNHRGVGFFIKICTAGFPKYHLQKIKYTFFCYQFSQNAVDEYSEYALKRGIINSIKPTVEYCSNIVAYQIFPHIKQDK